MPQHWMGWKGGGAEGFVWKMAGVEIGEAVVGSYRTFDIIMVHYSSESSQCASASYTRGQAEYHLAVIEASVLWTAGLSPARSLPQALSFNCRCGGYTGLERVIRNAKQHGSNHVSPSLYSPLDWCECRGIDLRASFTSNRLHNYQSFNKDFKSAIGSGVTSASRCVVRGPSLCSASLYGDICAASITSI